MREKELEDHICEAPETLFGTGAEILGRQVQLPHGVADIIVWVHKTLVVELKTRPLKDQDIGQVLRYIYDVRQALKAIVYLHELPHYSEFSFKESIYSSEAGHYHGLSGMRDDGITGCLVGPSVPEKVLVAAQAAGIYIATYDEQPALVFEDQHVPQARQLSDRCGWSLRTFQHIRTICQEAAEGTFDAEVAILFDIEAQ